MTCTAYGDPESVSVDVVSRGLRSATVELRTGGFYAVGEGGGPVRVFAPGFDFPSEAGALALPVRRVLVDAAVGKRARVVSVETLGTRRFADLRPSLMGTGEVAVLRDGTLTARRRASTAPLDLSGGYTPEAAARLVGTVFQEERKSAVVELSPVRWDGSFGGLELSERVVVKLAFGGREAGESGRGSVGKALPRKVSTFREILAQLHVGSRGVYAVAFEDLFPQRRRGISVNQLRLRRGGEAVGFRVEPAGAVFGPGGVLYFYSEATPASTDFSPELAWELVRARDGIRIPLGSAAPAGDAVTSASVGRSSFESERFYQPGLLDAPDLWLWEGLASGATRTKSFTLAGVQAATSQPAELEVYLQEGFGVRPARGPPRERVAERCSRGRGAVRGEAVDCTVRAVWTDSLPKEEALPLVDVCLAAVRDGELSADELAAVKAKASALCRRGGESQRR